MTSTFAFLAIVGNALMAGGDIAPVEPVVVEETMGDEWEFTASINAWASGMSVDLPNGANVDITFKDIMDNLNFTAMSTLTARKGKWGLFTDVLHMNISKDVFVPVKPSLAITDIRMKAWIVTPMVTL